MGRRSLPCLKRFLVYLSRFARGASTRWALLVVRILRQERKSLINMTSLQKLTSLVVCGYLSWASPASADVVVDWNSIASQTIFTAVPPRPGPTAILDLAMVHAAMHDAVQAIEK